MYDLKIIVGVEIMEELKRKILYKCNKLTDKELKKVLQRVKEKLNGKTK